MIDPNGEIATTDNQAPPGQYRATFDGIAPLATRFGDAWRWNFTIAAGDYLEVTVNRITGCEPSRQSASSALPMPGVGIISPLPILTSTPLSFM